MPTSFLPKFLFIYILSSIVFTQSYSSQCLEHQKILLVELKNELIFNSSLSTKLVQWNQKDDECCKWHGVECDGAGNVISLQLDFEGISGGIGDSSTLFRLKYLEKLNLAYSVFNSIQIPRGIHNLIYLTHLNLSNARFSGKVPLELSLLGRLISLNISNPGWRIEPLKLEHPNLKMLLRDLTGLRELYLDSVNITSYDERRKWSHIISSSLLNLTSLSLVGCHLSGTIAKSFLQLHSLSVVLRLDFNHLLTVTPNLFANFKSLTMLSLCGCFLKGSFPNKIFQIPTLQNLDLSVNQLNGSLPPLIDQTSLSNLVYLNLGLNSFSGTIPRYLFRLPSLQELHLSGNKFAGKFEEFSIVNVSNIVSLDLGLNRLEGPIPNSLFQLHSLQSLRLDGNLFSGSFQLDKIQSLPNLTQLDLSYNNLSVDSSSTYGRFSQLTELGLASCNLSIYPDFIKHCNMTRLGLSNNQISGDMQNCGPYLCNSTNLVSLNLSVNKLSGSIPPCLLEKIEEVDLGQNNINGHIPYNFSPYCMLAHLDLNNNALKGKIPKSLENCKSLYYMNVGNNMINDTFPCMLSSSLILLVLHSNRFHGEVQCHKSWPDLHVIDKSSNNFSGSLKSINFSRWRSMAQVLDANIAYYIFGVSLTMKGIELKYGKIWPNFVIIDMSCNDFRGEIPNTIGDLSLLHHLNLSNNALNGSIPKSFGNLRRIEALDLSQNQLGGHIPMELGKLEFLQVLNLSYNELVGEIPNGRQLQTFPADSFIGNPWLCGFNLNISCNDHTDQSSPRNEKMEEIKKREIEWEYVSTALGYVVGLGSFLWLLVFCRSFRYKYFGKIDEVVAEMFDATDRRRRRRARSTRAIRNRMKRQ